MLSDIGVLIPWRGGDRQREQVWEHLRERWEQLGVELCVGVDDHGAPFNCSRAVNRAFELSTKPILMIFGADCLPDSVSMEEGLEQIEAGTPWVPLFDRTDYYNEYATKEIMRGMPQCEVSTDDNLSVPFQTGVLGFTREAYKEVGGMDERFVGWGGEDAAFRMALSRVYGEIPPLPHTLRCLWHDGSHRVLPQHNLELCQEYESTNNRAEMLSMIAKRGYYV